MTGDFEPRPDAMARCGCSLSRTRSSLQRRSCCAGRRGAQAQAGDAKAMLKAMSDYVGSQKTIELTFDSDIEVITPQLEKIQFTNSGEALLSRPDKLRAHRVGGYADVAMSFDGKTVSILGKHLNAYAQFDAPGGVDQLFGALRAGHGVALPFADLLLTNSYDALVAGVMEAKHIGRGVIDGRECEHLAFRNFDTDWQLWVEVGARPIPRKMVITSKTLNSAPQYTLRVKTLDDRRRASAGCVRVRAPGQCTKASPRRSDLARRTAAERTTRRRQVTDLDPQNGSSCWAWPRQDGPATARENG